MRLQDLMSKNVEVVSPGESAEKAWSRMQVKNIHHLVVMEGAAVVGVISERDLGGTRGAKSRAGASVGDLMTPHAVAGKPEMSIKQAANLMRGQAIGCLPVVEAGKLKGIITVADLLEAIGRGSEKPASQAQRAVFSRGRGKTKAGTPEPLAAIGRGFEKPASQAPRAVFRRGRGKTRAGGV